MGDREGRRPRCPGAALTVPRVYAESDPSSHTRSARRQDSAAATGSPTRVKGARTGEKRACALTRFPLVGGEIGGARVIVRRQITSSPGRPRSWRACDGESEPVPPNREPSMTLESRNHTTAKFHPKYFHCRTKDGCHPQLAPSHAPIATENRHSIHMTTSLDICRPRQRFSSIGIRAIYSPMLAHNVLKSQRAPKYHRTRKNSARPRGPHERTRTTDEDAHTCANQGPPECVFARTNHAGTVVWQEASTGAQAPPMARRKVSPLSVRQPGGDGDSQRPRPSESASPIGAAHRTSSVFFARPRRAPPTLPRWPDASEWPASAAHNDVAEIVAERGERVLTYDERTYYRPRITTRRCWRSYHNARPARHRVEAQSKRLNCGI